MNHSIELQGVSRRFGGVTALDDVSFSVPEHTVLGLLGRNGAGKTTLMSIIAGQDRPDAGSVSVLGHAPFEHGPTLSNIIYVRDNQRYPDDYRLRHVLRIAPAFAPNWNADLADELVDTFRIPAKTALKKLSRGQISSIAIVLGIASRAAVTLLDEPYLGLDVTARAEFHHVLLRDCIEHPRTVVLSTHLVEESAAMFDRVVIIDQGRVVVDDETDAASDRAFILSGTTSAVNELVSGQRVLESKSIGPLASATVAGTPDDSLRERAAAGGVALTRPSLQELVSAFGAGTPAARSTKEVKQP